MAAVEAAVLDRWSCLGAEGGFPAGESANRLLGVDLTVARDAGGAVTVCEAGSGRTLPVLLRYGHVWTSLGEPAGGIAAIPEAEEPDRRVVLCGAVRVRASAPRVVENFLDMAHFPYVHTDILGAEPHTEVRRYEARIRRDLDEVWATDCRFVQPQAALSAAGAIDTEYVYRVLSPFDVMLYKTCPNAADRRDAICLFVQPLDPDRCVAHPAMFLIDDASALTDLVHFQQVIFLQDRIILENQRPRLLPLEPRAEIPTRADASSVIYRRWLKEKGVRYGTTLAA
jgi:phenylpropionate dioxygenase-like ring-hydroxylating dioxygenase large terminal subunit